MSSQTQVYDILLFHVLVAYGYLPKTCLQLKLHSSRMRVVVVAYQTALDLGEVIVNRDLPIQGVLRLSGRQNEE